MAFKGHHRKADPTIYCRWCDQLIVRRYLPCGKLERWQDFTQRSYCSRQCNVNAIAQWRRGLRDEGRKQCGWS